MTASSARLFAGTIFCLEICSASPGRPEVAADISASSLAATSAIPARTATGDYVNADDKLDLVCHFDTQAAGFEPGDLEGIVKGSLKDGRRFEGRGLLKVVPVKRQR